MKEVKRGIYLALFTKLKHYTPVSNREVNVSRETKNFYWNFL